MGSHLCGRSRTRSAPVFPRPPPVDSSNMIFETGTGRERHKGLCRPKKSKLRVNNECVRLRKFRPRRKLPRRGHLEAGKFFPRSVERNEIRRAEFSPHDFVVSGSDQFVLKYAPVNVRNGGSCRHGRFRRTLVDCVKFERRLPKTPPGGKRHLPPCVLLWVARFCHFHSYFALTRSNRNCFDCSAGSSLNTRSFTRCVLHLSQTQTQTVVFYTLPPPTEIPQFVSSQEEQHWSNISSSIPISCM